MLDEVQPEASALALGPHRRVGQPDRRDEIAARKLGQHPGVDPVGLAGQGRQPLHLERVGDLHLPAGLLELVVDEAGAVHRLDSRPHRLPKPANACSEAEQAVSIRGRGTDLHRLALLIEQVKVETPATEIQTNVQHCDRPPLASSWWTSRSLPPRRPFFIAFLTMQERDSGTALAAAFFLQLRASSVRRIPPSKSLEPP